MPAKLNSPKFNSFKSGLAVVLGLLVITCIIGCGSGSGGDDEEDFIGAAIISIRTSPTEVDTGDRTESTIDISEVDTNGIFLKVRFPEALAYVLNSAKIKVDNVETPFPPSISTTIENENYLVFMMARSDIGDDNEATLTLQLEGVEAIEDALIEIDADIDDPLVDNSVEFDPDNPEFGAEDGADVTVIE